MSVITLKAHYDGKQVCLDEPHDLPCDAKLIVTLLPDATSDGEREDLYDLGRRSLARAYGDDEPDYSACLGQKVPDE